VVPHTRDIRAYFVVGEKDRTLQDARGIQNILRSKNIPFEEEVHPDLGHEFPPDFQESFDKATNFIFMEQE
jgi:esterase/lipase superfamily enzyme